MSKHWYFFTLTGRKPNLNTEIHLHDMIILEQTIVTILTMLKPGTIREKWSFYTLYKILYPHLSK